MLGQFVSNTAKAVMGVCVDFLALITGVVKAAVDHGADAAKSVAGHVHGFTTDLKGNEPPQPKP